jgi:4-hydroxythreonine-4-phosphate dehydrogenase
MDRAVIAITMGDPAGIGPEVAAKVLAQTTTWEICRPLMIGDPQVMDEAAGIAGANVHFREVEHPSEARFAPPGVDVLRPAGLYVPQGVRGTVNPTMGQAAALCLKTAIALAMDGKVQGIVSAPLNKEAFHLAGYGYADELAYLADLTASHDTFMLGMASSIWTAPVTEHVPFRQIPDLITADRVLTSIGRLHAALCRAEVVAPRIGVASLNVHAGEGGLFGREEIEQIAPAITAAREKGIDAQGPVPADMVFVRALAGAFDGVVFMYHDQANIARKLQPMTSGATLFMGLPVPCGTTAHGTAFDIAGKGVANPGSLEAALRYTVRLCGTH